MGRNSIYIKAESVVEFIDDIHVLFNDGIDFFLVIPLYWCLVFFLPFVKFNSVM